MKEMALALLIVLCLGVTILSTLFLSSIGLAAVNTTTIAVNVSEVGQIAVDKTYLEWIQVFPGNNGTDQILTITNTGSTTFTTTLYASVNTYSTETSNPLQGPVTGYYAGGFLVLKNASDTNYHFVNRLEWNDSNIVGSISDKNATYGVSWGKYRNKTQWWIWEIRKDNNNECLNTTAGSPNGAAVVIQNTQGSYAVSTGISWGTGLGNLTDLSFWSFSAGPLQDYCVAVKKNCQALMIYRWDKNSSFPTCTTRKDLNKTLAVGASISVTANVFVPLGVPSDNVSQSTLTITAT